jgi:exopolysaccharide biosynthesis polyprenyl glycosylphosphotransferase
MSSTHREASHSAIALPTTLEREVEHSQQNPVRINWTVRRRGWIALDIFLSAAAILAAYALQPRFEFGWISSNPGQPGAYPAALVYPWLILLTGHVAGLHDPLGDRRRWLAVLRVSLAVLGALGLFLLLLYAASLQQLGRAILAKTFIFSTTLLSGARVLIWSMAKVAPRRIGCYLDRIREDRLRGILDQRQIAAEFSMYSSVDSTRAAPEIAEFFRRRGVDEIIVSATNATPAAQSVWLECLNRGVQVTDISVFIEREYYKIPCDEIDATWLLSVDLKWIHPFYHRFKRLTDLVVSVVLGFLALPVLVAAGFAIWIESGGPIFYSQTRTGFRGLPFRIWKLRTMQNNAEMAGAQWATKRDPRVTLIGRVLRITRIDEIPQLWNVLRGEMSFIGPRPERPELVVKIAASVPLFPQRHWVKPGLTGWAQINYPYGASIDDAREKLSYDLYYIKNASLLLDLHIVLRTAGAVMKGSR